MSDIQGPGIPKKRSVIGSAVSIQGEVSGTQDLLVRGRVEGRILLPGFCLTVGREGRVKADLVAKVIRIDGHVAGSVQGEEQIRVNGRARGDLSAPQIILEEGCHFCGTVEMGNQPVR